MILDNSGNLYGTTYFGGLLPMCCGVVFKLSPPVSGRGLWTETVLHRFTGGSDGRRPASGLTFDGSGNLYGTTTAGGVRGNCCGVVFMLSPPVGRMGNWTETVLHTFLGPDGIEPGTDLVFDGAGHLYGAAGGGAGNGAICRRLGCGVVFELSPPAGGTGAWSEKTIYRFPGESSAQNPLTVAYENGNLYGVASGGAQGQGALFVLTPTTKKFWDIATESFTGNAGSGPAGALITDPAMSGATTFYGVTFVGGSTGGGTVYSWTP
jgi:hypothetical protein